MTNYKAQNLSVIDFPDAQAVSMDIDAVNNLILSQGISLVHTKAMKCVIGMIDQYDNRIIHDHADCSNGFIYKTAGSLRALFTSNNKQMQQQDMGLLDHSSVSVTVPSFYDTCNGKNNRIKVVPFDRFYLSDETVTVIHWQTFEANPSGLEKLSFPVECVEYLMDNNGKEYIFETDFEIIAGKIHWIGNNRPSFDSELGKGQVCSIRYEYRPYYYVSRMVHEIRLTQKEDSVTGERLTVLMPQAFVLMREYVFEKENLEDGVPATPRTQKEPK